MEMAAPFQDVMVVPLRLTTEVSDFAFSAVIYYMLTSRARIKWLRVISPITSLQLDLLTYRH